MKKKPGTQLAKLLTRMKNFPLTNGLIIFLTNSNKIVKKLKEFIKLLFIIAALTGCNSIRQAQYERSNRHIHTYQDLHHKSVYHTIVG
jgi:hypothetical protein